MDLVQTSFAHALSVLLDDVSVQIGAFSDAIVWIIRGFLYPLSRIEVEVCAAVLE